MGYLPGEYLSSDSQVRAWGTRISFYFDCSGSVNLKMAYCKCILSISVYEVLSSSNLIGKNAKI